MPARAAAQADTAAKRPFDIDEMLRRLEEAIRPYPKAMLFELFEEGYTSVFEQLVACILSIRTLDEVMLVTAQRLFARAGFRRTMVEMTRELNGGAG